MTKAEQNDVLQAKRSEPDLLEVEERRPDRTPDVPAQPRGLQAHGSGVESQNIFASGRVSIDGESDISLLPPPNVEKHQHEVENLKWQINYEKKLHAEMGQLLEDKVSNLVAQVKDLNSEIANLNA